MIGVLILIAIIVVMVLVSRAITAGRKTANANAHTSMAVSSTKTSEELSRIVAKGLTRAGLQNTGAFDGTSFYKLNAKVRLEVKVWEEDGLSLAKISMPSVRSTNGRPVRLASVSSALVTTKAVVQSLDPVAIISEG